MWFLFAALWILSWRSQTLAAIPQAALRTRSTLASPTVFSQRDSFAGHQHSIRKFPFGYAIGTTVGLTSPVQLARWSSIDVHFRKSRWPATTVEVASSPEHDETPPKRKRGRPPGMKLSDETRKRIAEARRGKKWDKDTRKKMAQSKLGRAHSQETIERMSIAHTGKRLDNTTRAKMSEKRQGQMHSPEVKERIRKSVIATQRKKKLMKKRGDIELPPRERDSRLGQQALEEMRGLRAQMDPWIRHYRKLYGKAPTLESTRHEFPSLHQNMVRYNELVQIVKKNLPSDDGMGTVAPR
eukprot:jgi/Bigna1/83997/fgenesh1_pg.120_\